MAVAAPSAMAKQQSKIRGAFASSGVVPAATGKVTSRLKPSKSTLRVRVKDLSPSSTYQLTVGGVSQAEFTTTSSGRARLRFQTPQKGSSLPLDFDPRGQTMAVSGVGGDVLSVVLSGVGEPVGMKIDERTDLSPTSLAGAAKAEARFRLKKNGRTTFKVELEDVTVGNYSLFVDGVMRATISVPSDGEGEVEFDSQASPPKILLDFDPRGLVIDVVGDAGVFFSGEMSAQASGVNTCSFSEVETFLTSTGVDPDGKAKARFRVRDDCDQDFRVEVEDVPTGFYEVVVDGVSVGSVNVVDTGLEVEGRIEFDSDPEDPGEVLLDFDPRDKLIEIRQGALVYFTGMLGLAGSGGGSTCAPEETDEELTSTGADADASADARFRVRDDCDEDFRVQAEDLPVGDYDVVVAGNTVAVMSVIDTGVKIEGEVEFDTDPSDPGEILLDFDPRGAVIEIRQGAVAYFSHTFGGGSGGSSGICEPNETELPLLNEGSIGQAKGKARLRVRDDCDEDFRVEIEDLPVGNYNVLVGGSARGVIAVADTGSEVEGEIEFDSDPDQPGEVLLDFDPRGELIEIEQGGTIFLSRDFPAT